MKRTNVTAKPRTRMTRDNTAVLLIDHQVGLFTGVRDLDVGELKHNVVGLAKAARVLGLPSRCAGEMSASAVAMGPRTPRHRPASATSAISCGEHAEFVALRVGEDCPRSP